MSELRIESSRVLQAVRFLLSRQCLQVERDALKQQQNDAEEQYRESTAQERRQQQEERKSAVEDTAQGTAVPGASVPVQ